MRLVVTFRQLLLAAFVGFGILAIAGGDCTAQNVISLNDALSIALNRSHEIKTTKFDLEQNQLNLEANLREQRTMMDLTWNLPNWTKSIEANQNDDGSFSYFDNNRLSTGAQLDIIQPLLMTNGRFFIRGSYDTDQVENETIFGLKRTYSWEDGISMNFSQPLFQPNTQKITLNRTRRNLDMSQRSFDDKQNDIYFQVISKYYNLVRAKTQLQIDQDNLAQNEDTYENTMNKYRAGIMAEVAALQAKVNLDEARVNFEQSSLDFKRELDAFKLYIGIPLNEEIDVEDIVADVALVEIDFKKALDEVMMNDVRIHQLENRKLNQLDNIETVKNERKFNADLVLSYGISERDDMSQPLEDQLFKDWSQTNRVFLDFKIPIFDWGAHKRRVESARVALKSLEQDLDYTKLDIRNQVQALVDRVNNSKARMEIQAQSEEIAEKSYSITVERYDIGEIDIEQLYQDNQRLKNTRIRVLNAKIDYLTSVAQLNRVTYWDFTNNRPLHDTLSRFIQN